MMDSKDSAAIITTGSTSSRRYWVLVEFVFKHLDFSLAELDSVLLLHGLERGTDNCQVIPLPAHPEHFSSHALTSTDSTTASNARPLHRPFVLLSLPSDSPYIPHNINNNNATAQTNPHDNTNINTRNDNPTTMDIGCILLSRCTLVRSVLEIWGLGESLSDCAHQTMEWTRHDALGRGIFHTHGNRDHSWKITIHTLGSTFSIHEQEAFRAHFQHVGWQGDVRMQDPSDEYVLIREIALDPTGNPYFPRHGMNKELLVENIPRPALAWYFGRVLGQRRLLKGRGGIEEYSLKKRSYLGPTSMDAELSFIMTNLGLVRPGSWVLDPFVGTGSILLSCACRGAYCVGTDIDIRVLRGRGPDENIVSNFRQFNLPRPELIRSDNALYHRHFHRSAVPIYDAIICDPPYGIRAGARKSGSRLDEPRPVEEDRRHSHIAQTKPYAVSDVMADLLDVAARTLVMGGRLVYIIPSMSDFDASTDLPRHDCLSLMHVCYQPLSADLGRRMVAMKKVAPYNPQLQSQYLSSVWTNGLESAEKCANIRDKLIENAKKKPKYEERAAFRKEKRRQNKEEKKSAKRSNNL
jgi:tRNA (guanine10-N2)-methyltransferase